MPLSDAWPWLTFLACVLAPLALIDLRRQVIPNALNLTLALGGLAFAYVTGHLVANLVTAALAVAVLVAMQAIAATARGRQRLGDIVSGSRATTL